MRLSSILDMPVRRGLACGRAGLIVLAAIVLLVDPPTNSWALRASSIAIVSYGFLAAFLVAEAWRNTRIISPLLESGLDIAASSILIYCTDRWSSPFFAFFVFIQVAAALRWNWRGTIVTAAVLACATLVFFVTGAIGLGSGEGDLDIAQPLIRAAVLFSCGGMLAYLSAYRQRTKLRFAELARWAGRDSAKSDIDILADSLQHVAAVMRMQRILVVWEEAEEVHRNVCLWSNGEVHVTRERPDIFGTLVEPVSDMPVHFGQGNRNAPNTATLDPALRRAFAIETALVVRFSRLLCEGWVLFPDRPIEDDEEVSLAEIVATRVASDLEDGILRQRIARDLLTQERVRLGRDLHDGVLQGLAAASIQLATAFRLAPAELQVQLGRIRSILHEEAQHIRSFVERARSVPIPAAERTSVAADIRQRAEMLQAQWNCAIDVKVEPPDLATSQQHLKHLRDMLSEAVSNAVRHGNSRRVAVRIASKGDRLALHIVDDGQGFANFAGAYGLDLKSGERAAMGPMSLRSRAEELGGQLYIATDDRGTDVTIEFPS
jgi:signal transduction histidine kinase